jgi:hypothetical protein
MSSKIEQLVEECEQRKRKTKGLQKEIDLQKTAVEAKEKVMSTKCTYVYMYFKETLGDRHPSRTLDTCRYCHSKSW